MNELKLVNLPNYGNGFPDVHSISIPMDRLSQGPDRQNCLDAIKFFNSIKYHKVWSRSHGLHACYALHRLNEPNWQIRFWRKVVAVGMMRDYQFMISFLTYCLLSQDCIKEIWENYQKLTPVDPILFIWGMALAVCNQTFYVWPFLKFVLKLHLKHELPLKFYHFVISNLPPLSKDDKKTLEIEINDIPHLQSRCKWLLAIQPKETGACAQNKPLPTTLQNRKKEKESRLDEATLKRNLSLTKEYQDLEFLPVDPHV